MKKLSILIAFVFAITSFQQPLLAEISVFVSTVDVNAGTTARVEVSATGDEALTSFDIPFDIGNDGFPNIAPAGLDLTQVTSAAPFGSAAFFGFAENLQEDVVVTDLSLAGGVTLSSDPTLLFTLEFAVAESVPAGTVFDLTVIRDDIFAINGVNNPGDATTPEVTVEDGQIRINAVPEPSGFAIVALALGGMTIRRRRA